MLVPKQRSKASATHNPRTNFGYLFPAHDSFFYRYFVCNEFFWGKNYVLGQWPSQWWYENDTDYPPKGYIVEGLPLNPPPEEWQVACTKNPIPDLNLAYYNALDEHLAEIKKSMAENRMSKVVSNKKQRAEVDRTRSKKKTPWQREEGTGKLIRVDVPIIVEDDNDSSVSDKEVVGNDAKNGTENAESSTKEPAEDSKEEQEEEEQQENFSNTEEAEVNDPSKKHCNEEEKEDVVNEEEEQIVDEEVEKDQSEEKESTPTTDKETITTGSKESAMKASNQVVIDFSQLMESSTNTMNIDEGSVKSDATKKALGKTTKEIDSMIRRDVLPKAGQIIQKYQLWKTLDYEDSFTSKQRIG